MPELRPSDCYRMPWSLTDNVLGWLEPTKRCNLSCEGCYSRNDPHSDKPLSRIRSDLESFVRQRRMDSISIAGGDPLLHPDIVEIVRTIRHDYGLKPVLNTNGLALDEPLLRALKKAGLFGFTFHIDSSQNRPGWKHADEVELNALRLDYARRVAEVGGLTTSFNATIFPHTLKQVPALIEWAGRHPDVVHNLVFILFRTSRFEEFDYLAHGRPIGDASVVYRGQEDLPRPLTAQDVLETVWEEDPSFRPSAYLGGTKDPESFKWLITARLTDGEQVFGYMGPKYMEMVQTGHHALFGRYMAYSPVSLLSSGRSMMASGAAFDPHLRAAAAAYARAVAGAPRRAARPVRVQTVAIIQPIDMLAGGEINMCDGCPDMTVHGDALVWSCRLDEMLQHGCFLTARPKAAEARPKPSGHLRGESVQAPDRSDART